MKDGVSGSTLDSERDGVLQKFGNESSRRIPDNNIFISGREASRSASIIP